MKRLLLLTMLVGGAAQVGIEIGKTLPPQPVQPAQLIALADVVEGALRVQQAFNDRRLENYSRGPVDLLHDRSPRSENVDFKSISGLVSGNWNFAIGMCSAVTLTTESRDLLLGDKTEIIPGRDGFVNLGNRLCFWRTTGEQVPCPPPAKCGGAK